MIRRDILKWGGVGALIGFATGKAGTQHDEPTFDSKIKGIIFMVSDGMSPGVLTLAQAYSQMTRKTDTAWFQLLKNPHCTTGLMDTASANSLVTDSAAASSAWGGGQRVNNGQINIDPQGKPIEPIASVLKRLVNAQVGLVTTATVTHATPAGFAANVDQRGNEREIAKQYLNRVDVILGGGKGHFMTNDSEAKPSLMDQYRDAGYDVVFDKNALLATQSQKLLGVFCEGHLPFRIDRDHDESVSQAIPTLSMMASAALDRFLISDRPFLLQIEGARIDHAAHLNDIAGLLHEQLEFDDAIRMVLDKIAGRNDILLVVTSDHGNSNPGLNGTGGAYAQSNTHFARIADIQCSFEKFFYDWKKAKINDLPALKQLYHQAFRYQLTDAEATAILEKLRGHSIIEWSHQQDKPEGISGQILSNHVGVGWTGTSHTSDPTIISALGPHSIKFSGWVKNSDVFSILVQALS